MPATNLTIAAQNFTPKSIPGRQYGYWNLATVDLTGGKADQFWASIGQFSSVYMLW